MMHVALSDLLTCPRCGPTHGLILLPDEVRDRRVVAGVLGCANCRERYPVVGGVADLRVGGTGSEPGGGAWAGGLSGPEAVVRLAALLGLGEAGGTVLVAGPGAADAAALAEMLPAVSVVAVDVIAAETTETARLSVLRVGRTVPLRGGTLRGVALTGDRARLVEEGARLLGPAGRLVLDPAPEDASARVQAAGLRVLLEQDGVLVAEGGR